MGRFRPRLIVAGALGLLLSMPLEATATQLVPQTKFRVKVIQWLPLKGAYEEWSALGGEFIVPGNGEVALPVIGLVPIAKMDNAALAEDIAKRLQEKTGLVKKPDVSVEVVEYPPFYVLGDVAKPGEYRFRDGLTVLQAVALSGGERRAQQTADEIRLAGELRALEDEAMRRMARIARLEAESTGAKEIRFPALDHSDSTATASIINQERMIFSARAEEIERQTASLSDLRALLGSEIEVLKEKSAALENSIKSTDKELTGVKSLIAKGFAAASRQSDLERALADRRVDQLDLATEIMRARQGMAEATRNLEGIKSRRRTEVALELQTEQAALVQNRLKRDLTQRLLVDALSPEPTKGGNGVSFTIRRDVEGRSTTIAAEDRTLLEPGDVLDVTYADTKSDKVSGDPPASGLASAGMNPR